MHAKATRPKLLMILAAMVALAIFLGFMPASASSTVDVNGQQLEFDEAKFFNGTSLGALVTQTDQNNSNSLDMGVNAEVGNYLNYYNVITVGGVQVDARLTFLSELDLEGDGGALSQVEEMDEAYGDPGENKWINLGIDFVDGDDDSYGEFKVEFFTDIEGAATPVTLQNVRMSTYDIDGTQYMEISDFNRYFLSTNTILTVSQPRSGITRFAEVNDVATSGADSLTKTRVSVDFDSVSSLVFRVGKQALPGNPDTGSASFSLDFSIGEDWGGLQAEAVISPVLADPIIPSVEYRGPVSLRHQASQPCAGGTAIVTGQRLNTIRDVKIGSESVAFEVLPSGNLSYSLQGVEPGRHVVSFWVPTSGLTLTDSIVVASCADQKTTSDSGNTEVGSPASFFAQRLFANYRGDLGGVVAQDLSAITSFISRYSGIEKVTCVGSTSGVPAIPTDEALAQARAQNACDIIRTLVPEAEFTLKTSTGKGVGQKFRSVQVFVSGRS